MKHVKILSILVFFLLTLSFSGQAQSSQAGFTADKSAVKRVPKNKSAVKRAPKNKSACCANSDSKKCQADSHKASRKAFCASRDAKSTAHKMSLKIKKSSMKKKRLESLLKED